MYVASRYPIFDEKTDPTTLKNNFGTVKKLNLNSKPVRFSKIYPDT
jgi:hypothetical protein